METEDHPRTEAEPGKAKCNDLKVAGNSEIQIFELKIPLCKPYSSLISSLIWS